MGDHAWYETICFFAVVAVGLLVWYVLTLGCGPDTRCPAGTKAEYIYRAGCLCVARPQ